MRPELILAACAAGLAVWFWTGPVRGVAAAGPAPGERPVRTRARAPGMVRVLAAVGIVALAAALGGGAAATVAACGVLAVGTGASLARGHRREERRRQARRDVAAAADTVAGLLRAGRVPSAALVEAAADWPLLGEAAAELTAGGDVTEALARGAREPGLDGLRQLADAWAVAARTGAGLTEAWEEVSERLDAEEEVARTVGTEVAAARAAGRIMAVLPLVGVGLGYLLGGDPAAFLLGQPFGWACLVLGVGLACLGVRWTDAVVARAAGR